MKYVNVKSLKTDVGFTEFNTWIHVTYIPMIYQSSPPKIDRDEFSVEFGKEYKKILNIGIKDKYTDKEAKSVNAFCALSIANTILLPHVLMQLKPQLSTFMPVSKEKIEYHSGCCAGFSDVIFLVNLIRILKVGNASINNVLLSLEFKSLDNEQIRKLIHHMKLYTSETCPFKIVVTKDI